jgi:hypothetical protein
MRLQKLGTQIQILKWLMATYHTCGKLYDQFVSSNPNEPNDLNGVVFSNADC